MEKLDNVAQRLAEELPEWRVDPSKNAIERKLRFRDFVQAWGFLSRVALLAEAHGHHPELSNNYNRVRITLTTHDLGGVTEKDIQLATAIDALLVGGPN